MYIDDKKYVLTLIQTIRQPEHKDGIWQWKVGKEKEQNCQIRKALEHLEKRKLLVFSNIGSGHY